MTQDTTKIIIEFIAPVDNSEGVVKITSNEYGQELTNETTVKAVIWEAYRNSLINSIKYPVEGFENDNKATITIDKLVRTQSTKIFNLAESCNYNLGIKIEKIIGQNTIDFADNPLMRESVIYSQLLKLEKEIRDYAREQSVVS